MPLTSPPAQKAVPAPVIRSAPTSAFSPQVLIMVRSAGVRLSDSALRTSGRFSVMIATRSRITQRSSSVPVSIVVSVVVISDSPLFIRHCEEQSDEAIQLFARLDCFANARNDENVSPSCSEFLDPRPQFHLPGPGAARLLQHVPITEGDGVGIEHRIRPVGRL